MIASRFCPRRRECGPLLSLSSRRDRDRPPAETSPVPSPIFHQSRPRFQIGDAVEMAFLEDDTLSYRYGKILRYRGIVIGSWLHNAKVPSTCSFVNWHRSERVYAVHWLAAHCEGEVGSWLDCAGESELQPWGGAR